jgi:hypothetical protein
MDVSSLAASAVATSAQSTRDGFAVASLKIANDQQQLVANFVQQSAEASKALTQQGVGSTVDKSA